MQDFIVNLHYEAICLTADDSLGTCFGYAKSTRRRCRRRIPLAVHSQNKSKVLELSKRTFGEGDSLAEVLGTLANNLLCPKDHKDQTSTIQEALIKALKRFTNTHISLAKPSVDASPTQPARDAARASNTRSIPSEAITTHPIPTTIPPTSSLPCRSDFTPYCTNICTREQAEQLARNLMQKPLTVKCEDPGFIYLFRYQGVEGFLKIGYTGNIEKRMKDFETRCGRKPILGSDDMQRVVRHVYRAEQLVFAKLKHVRRRIICKSCGTNHCEWFEIDEADALRVIETVRRYMDEEYGVPEESNGQIKGNVKREDEATVIAVEKKGQGYRVEGGVDSREDKGNGLAKERKDQEYQIKGSVGRSKEETSVAEGRKDQQSGMARKVERSEDGENGRNPKPASTVRLRQKQFIPRRPFNSI